MTASLYFFFSFTFAQRAFAALVALTLRSSAVIFPARALPPMGAS